MANCEAKAVNDSLTTELAGYKGQEIRFETNKGKCMNVKLVTEILFVKNIF